MLGLLAVDATEEIVIDGAGKQKRVKVPVGRDLKIDICKTLANFFYPRLTATQVTGQNDGPIAVAGLNMIELMRDPIAIEAAQNLALAMAAQDQPPVESARALPAASEEPQHHPAIDPLDTLKTDGKGHWIPR
jgi:hypothetical protein